MQTLLQDVQWIRYKFGTSEVTGLWPWDRLPTPNKAEHVAKLISVYSILLILSIYQSVMFAQ